MAYSNGYNNTAVLAALFGRLAWSTDSTLSSANKTSASGRYFDDGSFHALVNVANVKATEGTPVIPDTWDIRFTTRQNAVINKCLSTVFNIPQFIDQVNVFTPDGSEQEEAVTNNGKAVGYKIDVAKDFDKTVQINSLELYFDEAATFNVYLFKQGNKTPLKTKSVTTIANVKTTVALTDWILNYKEAGLYYVVYFQDDLGPAQAINEQVCFNTACLFSAEAIMATVISGTDFDRVSPELPYQPNGLNMQISSFRDMTNNIIQQPQLFDELLGLVMAYTVIEQMIYTVISNASERIIKDQLDRVGIQLDLNGSAPISESPQVIGLKQRIDREAKRVKESFYPNPKAKTVSLC